MTQSQIIALQEHIGTIPDGFWGPKSIAACQNHLRRLMPQPNPWPLQSQVSKFYGPSGTESNLYPLSVRGLGIKYEGRPVTNIACHKLIAAPLLRVLQSIAASPDAWILNHYAGCYNNRTMRGGTATSMHAWGIALDFWPEKNGNRTSWPLAASMPLSFFEHWAREGFTPAGPFWGRDAMHVQATRP